MRGTQGQAGNRGVTPGTQGRRRGGAAEAPSTWRTRFILPMLIMKPSVQAMSEGEWPPPTTFTRLFCCLARASTCQDRAPVRPLSERQPECKGRAWPAGGASGPGDAPQASQAPAWLQAAVPAAPGKRGRKKGQEVSWAGA